MAYIPSKCEREERYKSREAVIEALNCGRCLYYGKDNSREIYKGKDGLIHRRDTATDKELTSFPIESMKGFDHTQFRSYSIPLSF